MSQHASKQALIDTILQLSDVANRNSLEETSIAVLPLFANLVVKKAAERVGLMTRETAETLKPETLNQLQKADPAEIIVAVKEELTRSWLAFSATNIPFKQGDLVLGIRSNLEDRAIPEIGDLALWGGFYFGLNAGLKMFAEIADAHFLKQTGITLTPEQCSPFIHCEYNMHEIHDPLNTPFGEIHIKRVAFDRIIHLRDDQEIICNSRGKIKEHRTYTHQGWLDIVAKGLNNISFPFQVEHITDAFERGFNFNLPKKVGFMA